MGASRTSASPSTSRPRLSAPGLPVSDARGVAEGRSRRLAAGASGTAVLLASLDAYVVVAILVDIVRDSTSDQPPGAGHAHRHRVPARLRRGMPLLGQLSDRLGRMRVLQGSLSSSQPARGLGLAHSLAVLVVARVLQGAAAGALLPVTFAVVGDLWDVEHRPVPSASSGPSRSSAACSGRSTARAGCPHRLARPVLVNIPSRGRGRGHRITRPGRGPRRSRR